jgi:hypothetical protein
MYVIIDWMLFSIVVQEDGSVWTWDTMKEAEQYGKQEMQTGLWQAVEVPPFAQVFKP